MRRHACEARDHLGMVTAEAALTMPLIAALALAMVWLVSVGITQVRVVDAARDAARAVARGVGDTAAAAQARRTAGRSAEVAIHRHDGAAWVTVRERTEAPRWLIVPLPGVTLNATSAVSTEE